MGAYARTIECCCFLIFFLQNISTPHGKIVIIVV